MSSTTRLLSALPLLAVLSACIAVPIGLGGEEPFAEEKLTFIEIGKSTKEDIAAAMPKPMRFLDGNTWLYARYRKEADWAVVGITLDGQPWGAATDNFDLRYLVIRFDDSDVVAGYEQSSSEKVAGCNGSGVCYLPLPGSSYMLVASEEQNRAIKQFDQPADHCAVYVYGKPSKEIWIELDDRLIGGLFDKKYFISQQISPGSHQLTAAQARHEPIEFTCAAGSSVFFEINKKWCGLFGDCGRLWAEVAQRDASEGRQAIAERDWMVTISDSTE